MRTPYRDEDRQLLDTPLACPSCGSRDPKIVHALPAKEVWKNGARQQDRWCDACGHKWICVLSPIDHEKTASVSNIRRRL